MTLLFNGVILIGLSDTLQTGNLFQKSPKSDGRRAVLHSHPFSG